MVEADGGNLHNLPPVGDRRVPLFYSAIYLFRVAVLPEFDHSDDILHVPKEEFILDDLRICFTLTGKSKK